MPISVYCHDTSYEYVEACTDDSLLSMVCLSAKVNRWAEDEADSEHSSWTTRLWSKPRPGKY